MTSSALLKIFPEQDQHAGGTEIEDEGMLNIKKVENLPVEDMEIQYAHYSQCCRVLEFTNRSS